ncbi:acyltransferase domain-containing protein [Bifidobacterium sp. SO4]|uniref:acyltransferase domain-containing protein n=1 Tax=Bifidobacterium sp. SO4 TaxID=2809030 RepID=UPI001BDD31D9|nr:acyltransferase domain-containing protein [Bifidobacterium sp. SO4]MBT1169794.1 DUF5596 domain-containing protein [Bifidobacterium sp. SO4]
MGGLDNRDSSSAVLTVLEVAARIGLAEPVVAELRRIDESGEALSESGMEAVRGLADSRRRVESWETLKAELAGGDPNGLRMLYWMLYAAGRYTYPAYRRMGIPDDIFDATMGCFARFVGEHRTSYGRYGFDRDFWTYRELSARLFRLGSLEFELAYDTADVPLIAGLPRVINVHIPSDASLDPAQCDRSVDESREFLAQFFPDWSGLPYWCESWLLSPALERLLPESSRILAFQRRFDIRETHPDAPDWREWVFRRCDAPIAELPEHTSLQRNMKRFLLAGGKVGVGIGCLR